jgi:hypothetical protein
MGPARFQKDCISLCSEELSKFGETHRLEIPEKEGSLELESCTLRSRDSPAWPVCRQQFESRQGRKTSPGHENLDRESYREPDLDE